MSPEHTLLLPEKRYVTFKKTLAVSSWFFQENRSLFALALGSNRSATFDAIAKSPEIEIIWRGSFLPWWARPFGVVASAYGGIVKITGPAGLKIVCDNLLSQSAMELLVISKDKESVLVDRLRGEGRKASAMRLAEEQTDGVLAAIFLDDDAMGDYPIIYRQSALAAFPLLQEYERL